MRVLSIGTSSVLLYKYSYVLPNAVKDLRGVPGYKVATLRSLAAPGMTGEVYFGRTNLRVFASVLKLLFQEDGRSASVYFCFSVPNRL